jgi:hypothetical protein
MMQKISLPAVITRTRKTTLHSQIHLLADDLSEMMGEKQRFGAYLGIARRYRESDLRALARRVREKEDLPAPARGKYFFAALRGMTSVVSGRSKVDTGKKKRSKNKYAKRTRGRTAPHRQRTA